MIRLERDGPIAHILLDDPARLNALGGSWPEQMLAIIDAIRADDSVRVVTIAGAGEAFSSGLNLDDLSSDHLPEDFFRRAEDARVALERLDRPVIAGIRGYCLGGGLQLALACDDRIAADDARIGVPAAKEGLLPGLALYRLPRAIGVARSLHMLLSNEVVDAETAHHYGLVSSVVASDRLDDAVDRMALAYSLLPNGFVIAMKRLVRDAHQLPIERFREAFEPAMAAVLATDSHREAKERWKARKGVPA